MKESIFRPGGLALTEASARKISVTAQSPVLDVGCGAGYALLHLHRVFGCPVFGADLSEACVRQAKRLLPDAEILVADAADLPFSCGQFYAVFMECVLTLFPDPAAALAEAFRVLAPGGSLVVSTLSRETGQALIEQGAASLNLLIPALQNAGFSVVDCEDHTDALVQFVANAIFRYGSLDAYLREASSELGGAVLTCGVSPKNTRYHLLTARK